MVLAIPLKLIDFKIRMFIMDWNNLKESQRSHQSGFTRFKQVVAVGM
jgi:hypothetical protein